MTVELSSAILAVGAYNGLLTGDIGSGKSTMVDAITTLLLPANRISYNKAARGGDQGTEPALLRARLSQVGEQRAERHPPIGVRTGSKFSVLLGTFSNEAYDQEVTLAQVFWLREGRTGQPDRFFVSRTAR